MFPFWGLTNTTAMCYNHNTLEKDIMVNEYTGTDSYNRELIGGDLPRPTKVKSPVNFRPTEARFDMIELIRVKLGLNTRTEAIEAAIDLAANELGLVK